MVDFDLSPVKLIISVARTLHIRQIKALLASRLDFVELNSHGFVLNRFASDTFISEREFPDAMQGILSTGLNCLSTLVQV